MSDLRDLEPAERIFEVSKFVTHEVEIAAWPYSGIKNKRVISRKLIYRIETSSFDKARAQAGIALMTVQAMHDIWVAKIVRIEEVSR